MCLIVGWATRNSDDSPGYMYCPDCRTRKPAVLGFRKTYLTLFFIPLFPLAVHEGYYRCDGCEGMFDPDAAFPFDFGDHVSPKVWTCRFCQSPNPSHCHQCQTCQAEA